MSSGEREWRFKETIGGSHYGAHSKEAAGSDTTMQEERQVTATEISLT